MPRDPAEPIVLTVDAARERILAAVAPLPAVGIAIEDALGLVTAAPVAARADLPPFDNSAMDGFAVRVADTAAASERQPVMLRVNGSAPAGATVDTVLAPGTAVRIMTGAPVPPGADGVIRFEHVDRTGTDRIALSRPVRPGENIRPAGEDARAGQEVLAAGVRLRAAEVALLAGSGHATVRVHRRPRVGVLVTGDEVTAPGEPLAPGRIWNSNGPLLAAQIREAGGDPVSLGVATDTERALRERLAGLAGLDLLVTTGGVSVGDFDVVKDVLRDAGEIAVWSLRIRPGKPLAFGTLGGVPVIGLPGNPVAAAVAGWQFVRPAVRRLLGCRDLLLPEITARMLDPVENRGGRRHFVRVRVERDGDGYTARLAGGQGSAMLTSLAAADGLLIIPEDTAVVASGDALQVQRIDR